MGTKLPLNHISSFCKEMVAGQGEDSFCHAFCDTAGLIAVFDGCGGAGARKHGYYSDRTEAFMASRLCAGVFYDQFRHTYPAELTAEQFVSDRLVPALQERLREYQPPKDPESYEIRGSMVRTLPTTAAAALIRQGADGSLTVSAIWAGDSRIYILDAEGLAQLTVDDTSVPDPMENLYEDGVLKNILCSGRAVKLHCSSVRMTKPFLVIGATDGCFGYLSTPMEFEGLLLQTLMASGSVAQWEQRLASSIGQVAGDDHTLCMAAYGDMDLRALQTALAGRFAMIRDQYLTPLSKLPLEDRQTRREMWESYKAHYYRYMKDGQT